MQALCVVPTFPQDRAVVTNTCSKRKDGFSYGFLVASGRLSEEVLFIAIKKEPRVSFYCNAAIVMPAIVMPAEMPAQRSHPSHRMRDKSGRPEL